MLEIRCKGERKSKIKWEDEGTKTWSSQRASQRKPLSPPPPGSAIVPKESGGQTPDDKPLQYTRWYQLFCETVRDLPTEQNNRNLLGLFAFIFNAMPPSSSEHMKIELEPTQRWMQGTLFEVHVFQELRCVQAKIYYLEKEVLAWKISKPLEFQNLEGLKDICKYWGLALVPFYAEGQHFVKIQATALLKPNKFN